MYSVSVRPARSADARRTESQAASADAAPAHDQISLGLFLTEDRNPSATTPSVKTSGRQSARGGDRRTCLPGGIAFSGPRSPAWGQAVGGRAVGAGTASPGFVCIRPVIARRPV